MVHTHSHVVSLKYVKVESSSAKRNKNLARDKSMNVATGLNTSGDKIIRREIQGNKNTVNWKL